MLQTPHGKIPFDELFAADLFKVNFSPSHQRDCMLRSCTSMDMSANLSANGEARVFTRMYLVAVITYNGVDGRKDLSFN